MAQLWRSRGVGVYRASEIHALVTSRMYKPNGQRRGIIFCHAYTQDGDSNVYPTVAANLSALAADGYPVLSCDLGAAAYSADGWGNADTVTAITAAYTYLTTTVGAHPTEVGLLGASMGAQNALVWARQNLTKVFAAALTIPVLDPDAIYQAGGALRTSIETAHGITHPTAIPSIATVSPTSFGSADLAGLPLKIWASSNDPVASTTAQCQAWVAAGAKGANADAVVDLGAVGHVGGSTPPADVVAHFNNHGGWG